MEDNRGITLDEIDEIKRVKALHRMGIKPETISKELKLDLEEIKVILNMKRRRPGLDPIGEEKRIQKEKQELQDKVKLMRDMRENGHSIYKIAAAFGMSAANIQHHTRDVKAKVPNKRSEKSVLSEEDLADLKYLKGKLNMQNDQIARFLKTTEPCIQKYIKQLKLDK